MARVIDITTRKVLVSSTGIEISPEMCTSSPPVKIAPSLSPFPNLDLFKTLFDRSTRDISGLVTYYKSSPGKWNSTAERLMTRVMGDIRAVCASIASGETK